MRIKHFLIPASLAVATAFALPGFAQNRSYDSDTGWGDMGRSSEYYDFRDPGPDRNYNRYEDSLRDWGGDRQSYRSDSRWNESQRDMNRYGDRRDDWRAAERYPRRGYRDYDSAQRDNYDYYDNRSGSRYRDEPYMQEGRDGYLYWRNQRYDDRYSGRYDRDWRADRGRGGDYTADRYGDPDFGDMDIREQSQWNERSYRGTANRGLRD
jgi:hypothetical protein